jgi:hypothetical protein
MASVEPGFRRSSRAAKRRSLTAFILCRGSVL